VLILLLLERNYAWAAALARFPRFIDILKIFGLFVPCGGVLTLYAAKASTVE
jgi:hypothetical protein